MTTPLPEVFDVLAGPVGFGASVTLTRIIAGVFDPITGGTTPPATTNFPVAALVESFPFTDNSGNETDVESVKRGEQRIHVKASDLSVTLPDPDPDASWTATINGDVLRVLEVDVVNAEIYVLHVRR